MPVLISRAARLCCAGARKSARARSACSLRAVLQLSKSCRRPRVAVLSTGDELVEPGRPLRPGGVYDSNGAIIAAAVAEAGGEAGAVRRVAGRRSGARTGDAQRARFVRHGGALAAAPRRAPAICRIASCRGSATPGILVHGVALKPGKPLCLAVIGDKPLVVLPGFPTSAIFTFHAFVAPIIRARAGLPPKPHARSRRACRCAFLPKLGREEFVLVSLVAGGRRPDRVSDRQRIGRGDRLLASRRFLGDRCARFGARCRAPKPKSR